MSDTRQDWLDTTYKQAAERAPERDAAFQTSAGRPVEPLYAPDDLAIQGDGFDYSRELGFPGVFPFTRGVQPTMYRGRLWTVRQYAGFATAEESN